MVFQSWRYNAVCIDWDKIEGFNALFPGMSVEKVAKGEYTEWHEDNKTRGHYGRMFQ